MKERHEQYSIHQGYKNLMVDIRYEHIDVKLSTSPDRRGSAYISKNI